MKTLFFSCCIFLFVTASGQKAIPDETFPVPRDKPLFIYHPPSKALLLAGGSTMIPDSTRSDVWKWQGKEWSGIEAEGPGARAFFPGTLNTKTNFIHFFGGIEIGIDGLKLENSKGDMWTFDGKRWSKLVTNHIGVRHHHNIVYADHLDAFVLYGGYNDSAADTVTWLMSNGQFTPMHIPGPGVRYQSAMIYDKSRKRVVLYGGGDRPNEHWEFDGTKWEKLLSAVNPGIKFHHHMVYDDKLKAVILHGGWVNLNSQDPKNLETPITWMWDGKTWKKIAEERMFSMALAYDESRKSVIAYGYNDGNTKASRNIELWELKNTVWKKIADYGKWSTIDYLKKRVEQNPHDIKALAFYSDQLRSSKQFAEAETAYKKLEKVYPQKISILISLAEVLLMQNKKEEAEEYLVKLTNSGLMNRDLYIRLGNSLIGIKEFQKGARYYEKALEIEPKAGDFYNIACAYALMNEKDKSFANLARAAEYGYNRKKDYESDSDLESLKSDARWKVLVEKLK